MKIYTITEDSFNSTNYRPNDIEIEEIETEDGWSYKDYIENILDGVTCIKIKECSDIIVWKVADEIDNTEYYVVEMKIEKRNI